MRLGTPSADEIKESVARDADRSKQSYRIALVQPALACAKSVVRTDSPRQTWPSIQPMIPAHDCSGLHVSAGTWQSPADL